MKRTHTGSREIRIRPGARWLAGGLLVLAAGVDAAWGQKPLGDREVIDGITTTRIVQGEPYELAGKRIVFTNWYYIQPGDLDWRNKKGESVYVHGDEGLFDAYHVGIRAHHGIRLVARKPIVVGPIDLPYRTILQHGGIYKGWTSTEYCESVDGMHWQTKTQLVFDERNEDGVHHVFVDPGASPAERFKAVWVGHISRAEFDTFRRQRPDGWEPRALFLLGEKDQVTCLRGSVSPDGIHWTTLPDPLVVEYSDTLNTAYYDGVLKINAVTQRTGWVKAEVVGAAGRSLADCQPLVGDQHWTQLTWKGGLDLGVEPGRPITLKFELYQARLFGLEFE